MKRILMGSNNPAKVTQMRELLRPLPLLVLSPLETGITICVHEDGHTPEENAKKKAQQYFNHAGIATFAIDSSLYLESFPPEKQPGLHVRRIRGDNDVSDEEMITYYITELDKVGGESKGIWTTAVALVSALKNIDCEHFESKTLFTSKPSHIMMIGEPLNSLQVDIKSGKYFSEMSSNERSIARGRRAQGIFDFIERHLSYL